MTRRATWLTLALTLAGASLAHAAVLQVPGQYATIQAAVNAAAPGDVVSVAAGTYEEQLDIAKDLTIAGAGPDATIIRCPTTITNLFQYNYKPAVYIHHTLSVALEDLTLDGYSRAEHTYHTIGVAFWCAGGALRRVVLRNWAEATMTSSQTGVGAYAYNNLAYPDFDIAVEEVLVETCQKSGLAFYGRGLNVTIDGVEIQGGLLSSPATQNGLEFGLNASGTVRDAKITGFRTATGYYSACGALLYNAGSVNFDGCRLENNETSFYFINADARADGCSALGLDEDRNNAGFAISNMSGLLKAARSELAPPMPFLADPAKALADADKAAKTVVINGCTITGRGRSGSAGIIAKASLGDVHLDVANSSITNWDYGMDLADGYSSVLGDCRYNAVNGNMTYGIAAVVMTEVDARWCWWGDTTGPRHWSLNPGGAGNEVSDMVLFLPWSAPPAVPIEPAAPDPMRCDETITLVFSYAPDPLTPGLRGFEYIFRATGPLACGSGDIVDLDPFAGLGPHSFYLTQVDAQTWTVSCALLGGSVGLEQAADLFRVTFHPTGSGTSVVSVTGLELRALDNGAIPVTPPPGVTIVVDCDAPDPVGLIAAAPGHRRVDVSWDASPSPDVATYEIWRARWHRGADPAVSAYPEYDDWDDDVTPTRPTAYAPGAEWTLAGSVPGGDLAFTDTGDSTRGVYCYEIFAKDAAGNVSLPAAANDRATNYWLGDVKSESPGDYDGRVSIADITKLGAAYGLPVPTGGLHCQVDVGPTDDWSRTGVPVTDSVIDFEDLMIFSLNFAVVAPKAPAAAAALAELSWVPVTERTWSLRLDRPCPGLKGLNLSAGLSPGAVARVEPGELLAGGADRFFLRNVDAHGLDAGLAALGEGETIAGAGELVRVTLPAGATPGAVTVVARDADNRPLAVVLGGDGAVPAPVAATRLEPNVPNPFNPQTAVRFTLAREGRARLRVHGLDGRLVRTLLDADLPAGPHATSWDGRDDGGRACASGSYICRLEAAGVTECRKMVLMK